MPKRRIGHLPRSRRQSSRRASLHRQLRAKRPLHKRIFLHPASLMTLLVAGVMIIGVSLGAAADSYTVAAKVPAPPLSGGAIITSPSGGAVVTASPITVSGSCPDSSYVKLFRNNVFSGTAICSTNLFTITTSLIVGTNTLLAQDYNITDDPGPATPSITVAYQPPAPPVTGSYPTSPTIALPSLLLTSDYHFQAFTVGTTINWILGISGGTAPYLVKTDWSDGQVTSSVSYQAQTFVISHRYSSGGYYPIITTVTDAGHTAATLQLVALIKKPGAGSIVLLSSTPSGPTFWSTALGVITDTQHWLWLAWPTYLTLSLMAASFWLGEQRELRRLLFQPVRGTFRHARHS